MVGWRALLVVLAIGAALTPGLASAQIRPQRVDDHGWFGLRDNDRGRDFDREHEGRFFGNDDEERDEVHPYFTPEYPYNYDYGFGYTPSWAFGDSVPYYYSPYNPSYSYSYGYNPYVPYSYSNPAFSIGYHYGVVDGQHDRLMGDSFRPKHDEGYSHPNRYYSSSFGSRRLYDQSYREGYLQGYIAGYDEG